VLAQTFSDFELVIIDDASTDGSAEILRTFECRGDGRIHIFRNRTNLELTKSLVHGMALARGAYVARIDADDLCLPNRAAIQVEFLDAHREVGVVGSFIETFTDETKPAAVVRYPTEPDAVAAALLFRNPVAHPAVMIRREALTRQGLMYDPRFRRGQDYDLWVRCIDAKIKLANIPEVLTRYRVHAGQATRRDRAGVYDTGAVVRQRLLERLGVMADDADRAMHEDLCWDNLTRDFAWLRGAAVWLESMFRANERTGVFERDALGRVLCGRWVRVLTAAQGIGEPINFTASPLATYLDEDARGQLRPPTVEWSAS